MVRPTYSLVLLVELTIAIAASGSSDRAFRLPLPPAPSSGDHSTTLLPSDYVDVRIRDTTLLADSTGHQTWGAGILMAQTLSESPASFFPTQPTHTPLRLLELGSGTGIVGIYASMLLRSWHWSAQITLSDYLETINENLRYNLTLNKFSASLSSPEVISLDWNYYHLSRTADAIYSPSQAERYDTIIGSDLVYEPNHMVLLHATVSSLLRFPNSSSEFVPTFHLIMAIRSTHAEESNSVLRAFSTASYDESMNVEWAKDFEFSIDEEGTRWRLIAKTITLLTAPSGFLKESEFRLFEIGWQRLKII